MNFRQCHLLVDYNYFLFVLIDRRILLNNYGQTVVNIMQVSDLTVFAAGHTVFAAFRVKSYCLGKQSPVFSR